MGQGVKSSWVLDTASEVEVTDLSDGLNMGGRDREEGSRTLWDALCLCDHQLPDYPERFSLSQKPQEVFLF